MHQSCSLYVVCTDMKLLLSKHGIQMPRAVLELELSADKKCLLQQKHMRRQSTDPDVYDQSNSNCCKPVESAAISKNHIAVLLKYADCLMFCKGALTNIAQG